MTKMDQEIRRQAALTSVTPDEEIIADLLHGYLCDHYATGRVCEYWDSSWQTYSSLFFVNKLSGFLRSYYLLKARQILASVDGDANQAKNLIEMVCDAPKIKKD